MNRPQLILLGAPGSGKGTQAKELVEKLNYKHLSTGDLLRIEISKKSALGLKVADILNAGNLVDDDTVLELLKLNCDFKDSSYIFDGFPRNLLQAQSLDKAILGEKDKLAIYFDIDLTILVERIVNRRTCSVCGEIYNLVSRPSKVEDKCDLCGGALKHRKDDTSDVVQNRLEVYKAAIDPILAYYKRQGNLLRLDAGKKSEDIFSELETAVKV